MLQSLNLNVISVLKNFQFQIKGYTTFSSVKLQTVRTIFMYPTGQDPVGSLLRKPVLDLWPPVTVFYAYWPVIVISLPPSFCGMGFELRASQLQGRCPTS
jgi:hypothetical protein